MRFREHLFPIIITAFVCVFNCAIADGPPSKSDLLSALGEFSYDKARFERNVALARSLGVSDSQILIARFGQALGAGEIGTVKQLLPDVEKALSTMPESELGGNLDDIRQFRSSVQLIKKYLSSGEPSRLNEIISTTQRKAEARSILSDLIRIDSAVDVYALENRLGLGAKVPAREWIKKLQLGSRLRDSGTDIFGVAYGDQIVGQDPTPNPSSAEKVAKFVPEGFFKIPAPTKKN
jgi:hypothetical protein